MASAHFGDAHSLRKAAEAKKKAAAAAAAAAEAEDGVMVERPAALEEELQTLSDLMLATERAVVENVLSQEGLHQADQGDGQGRWQNDAQGLETEGNLQLVW